LKIAAAFLKAPLGATNAVEHNEPAHPSSRERTRRTRSGRAWLSAKLVAGVFIVMLRRRA
jgi:hypothetical protein